MIKPVALAAILLAAAPANPQSPAPTASATSPAPQPLTPDELFSRRALRRARLLIQMRLLQLRDEQLECVRDALLRRLPDALWQEEPEPSRGAADAASAAARCGRLLRF
ncbi:MAG: hypothetical protein JO113_05630 [Candidatus Eremiobacteraeota bacterium]|nr:hypothetical protein [Candidatus Eremiobacteraeota bacterium]